MAGQPADTRVHVIVQFGDPAIKKQTLKALGVKNGDVPLIDRLPRKADDECMTELRWIYDRRTIEEARQDLTAWLKKWGKRYQQLCNWVEGNIDETLTPSIVYPASTTRNLKSRKMLEPLMEEIKRRTLVVRIFPMPPCLRLVRALAVEMHENGIEAIRYLNMDYLREHKKEQLRRAAA